MISNFRYISQIAEAYEKMRLGRSLHRRIVESSLKKGRDRYGYDERGFDILGYDREGYDETGHDMFGCDRSGYDDEGYDRLGYNREGWGRDGSPSPLKNPEAYMMSPEEVESKMEEMLEIKRRHAKTTLYKMLKSGQDIRGVYIKEMPRRTVSPEERSKIEKFKKSLNHMMSEYGNEQRKAERLRMKSTPEWKAEQSRKRQEFNTSRRTPEFRAKNAAYMRDYNRAKRLIYGNVGWTPDDIIWSRSSELFKKMQQKKEERERREREAEIERRKKEIEAETGTTVPSIFRDLIK